MVEFEFLVIIFLGLEESFLCVVSNEFFVIFFFDVMILGYWSNNEGVVIEIFRVNVGKVD